MKNSRDQRQDALHSALNDLETSVETPFVPGEFERWLEAVVSSWQRVHDGVSWLIDTRHPENYAEIRREDQGLIRRVEQMRQDDEAIKAAVAELDRTLPKLQSAVTSVEPDEAKLKPTLDAFVQQALELIIRIRKQEQAVRTWLLEALTRDRGTVD